MIKGKILLVKLLLIFIIGVTASVNVFATENGGGAYPNGAEDFMAGAVPPPGTYFMNYLNYYTAGEFKDSTGNFDLKVTADVLRFVHVTKKQLFGGFWGVQIIIPVANVDITLPVGSDSETGLGDITINPFILSWHSKNWHFATGFDIYVPIGSYDKDDLANVGRNYWTFEPIFGFTYISDDGFEISSKIMYDINTENDDTDYKSGQEFHFDYTVGKKFDNLSVGLGGYYYKQITDDENNGTYYGGTVWGKGQALALGPQLKYDYKNMSFALKYQKEISVENRPEGDKFWFKFVYTF